MTEPMTLSMMGLLRLMRLLPKPSMGRRLAPCRRITPKTALRSMPPTKRLLCRRMEKSVLPSLSLEVPKPARKRRKPSRAQWPEQAQGQTPEQLIFDAVRDAGVDGVGVADLAKLVRSAFKSFKVRDHGFAQMRQYIASLADIKVEKRGNDYFAVLEE